MYGVCIVWILEMEYWKWNIASNLVKVNLSHLLEGVFDALIRS